MPRRKVPLVTNEHYHLYLRGVEKRTIVQDKSDVHRFLLSLQTFNTTESVGSIYEDSFRRQKTDTGMQLGTRSSKLHLRQKLVDILAFNILGNHYHLLVRQCVDGGVSKFMQSLNGGYTKYFNNRYNRVGPLFQGAFGSIHIQNNSQLIYTSAYVSLNHVVHGLPTTLGTRSSKWGGQSSWPHYAGTAVPSIVDCNSDYILSHYQHSRQAYVREACEIAEAIAQQREKEKKDENTIFKSHLELGVPS